jgi:hypothetical protein
MLGSRNVGTTSDSQRTSCGMRLNVAPLFLKLPARTAASRLALRIPLAIVRRGTCFHEGANTCRSAMRIRWKEVLGTHGTVYRRTVFKNGSQCVACISVRTHGQDHTGDDGRMTAAPLWSTRKTQSSVAEHLRKALKTGDETRKLGFGTYLRDLPGGSRHARHTVLRLESLMPTETSPPVVMGACT